VFEVVSHFWSVEGILQGVVGFLPTEVAQLVMGESEESLPDVFHFGDNEAVVDEPEVVFAANVRHAWGGAGEFCDERVRFVTFSNIV
jgi:hypothetical protein